MAKKKYKVLDLFCGCGGISEGFALAGFNIAGGIDFNEYATITFKHNFRNAKVHNIDITTFPDSQIEKEYGDVDIIVGGPPCQGFSSANRWQKEIDDPRNKLFFEYIRFVQKIHPKIIMIENVRGLLTRDNGYAIKRIEEILGAEEYNIKYQILNASDYGVPQNRKRAVIVGIRKDYKDIDFDFDKLEKQEKTTVEDAIGELYCFEKSADGLKTIATPPDTKLRKFFMFLRGKIGETFLRSYGPITEKIDILLHTNDSIRKRSHVQLILVTHIVITFILFFIGFQQFESLLGFNPFQIILNFKGQEAVSTDKLETQFPLFWRKQLQKQ